MGLEYKESQGKCPKCGSDNIDFGAMVPEDEYVYYPASCNDCEAEFTEYYYLEYDNTGYDTDDEDSEEEE